MVKKMPSERFMQHHYGASGFVRRDSMEELSTKERNWRPVACSQCASDVDIIRTWMGARSSEQESGVCWQVYCGTCGGIFEMRLLESITINTEIKQEADKQIAVEQKQQAQSET